MTAPTRRPREQGGQQQQQQTDPLHEHHRRMLEVESAIDPEVIAERGYRTITKKADLARMGFARPQQGVPALAIPIHSVTGGVAWSQIRPDEPRIRKGKKVKYETPRA